MIRIPPSPPGAPPPPPPNTHTYMQVPFPPRTHTHTHTHTHTGALPFAGASCCFTQQESVGGVAIIPAVHFGPVLGALVDMQGEVWACTNTACYAVLCCAALRRCVSSALVTSVVTMRCAGGSSAAQHSMHLRHSRCVCKGGKGTEEWGGGGGSGCAGLLMGCT
jgi:hypothetical protein